jgi:LysR family nitrogen assimilation transcriptional regulator
MNSRTWRHFLKVAELGSITRACAALHMTQPALTRQIAALEEEIGHKLFVRHRRGLTLSEAGHILASKATSVLLEIDSLQAELESRASEPSGEISVGMPPSFTWFAGARIIARFAHEFPKVRVTFREASTEELVLAVRSGEIDAAVVTVGAPTRALHTEVFAQDYMALISPPGTRSAKRRSVTTKALSNKPLLLLSRTKFLMDRIQYAASRSGVEINVAMEANSMVIMELVERGMGYTIIPMCATLSPHWNPALPVCPITDLPIEWALCHRPGRPLTSGLAAFYSTLRSEVAGSALSHHVKKRRS